MHVNLHTVHSSLLLFIAGFLNNTSKIGTISFQGHSTVVSKSGRKQKGKTEVAEGKISVHLLYEQS